MRRKRGRPPSARRWLVVQMMLGVLAPRPGRPSIAESHAGAWKEAYAARIAADRYGVRPETASKYLREYLAAGGETPEALARRQYGALLDVEPYTPTEAIHINTETASTLRVPLPHLTKKSRN